MELNINALPDELLIKIFGHLSEMDAWDPDDELWDESVPCRQPKILNEPCPRLRSYPFLAQVVQRVLEQCRQVCKKWRQVLSDPVCQELVWRRTVISFGHELVTAIHTPLRWSNTRPSAADFQAALQATTLSATKILDFVGERRRYIRSLTLANSEAFYREDSEDFEYIRLAGVKHSFGPVHLGFMLGVLGATLQELHLYQCNDLLNADLGLWSVALMLPQLRVLSVEGINTRLTDHQLEQLGRLTKLEALSITGDEDRLEWVVGMDALPESWSRLTCLTCLELRGHPLLDALPAWLPAMTALRRLDISANTAISLALVPQMTQLEVLVLQGLALGQTLQSGERASSSARRWLPDLAPLAPRLRVLSLGMNAFTRVPEVLTKLSALEVLDMSHNGHLHIDAPLTGLAALPRIKMLDFRSVHVDNPAVGYWDDSKCETMQHLSKLAKALKRRNPMHRLFFDLPP